MACLNISKKVLYIQTMGKNYKTNHYFLQTMMEKGMDLFTEYKSTIIKWAKKMAKKDRKEAELFIEKIEDNEERKIQLKMLETWEGKTKHPISIVWDCDGFNEDLDESPAPTQFWLYTIRTLRETGYDIDMEYSQVIDYALDKKTIESLNGKKFMDMSLPDIFYSEKIKAHLYTNVEKTDDEIKKILKEKDLEHILLEDIKRPKYGSWSGDYGGEAKENPGEKAGSFYTWHEYLINNPDIEMTAVYCWCNIAAGIADQKEKREMYDAHTCMSSLANINRKEFGLNNQVTTLFIGDAKIVNSVLIWKNNKIAKAFRNWKEFSNTPINSLKIESTSYNSDKDNDSDDSDDSDTRRELYRYSINPNSIYMD